MPTGFTNKITEGQSFSDFALNCARAFGVLAHMRDMPADTPIPTVIHPQDYSSSITEAEKRLVKLKAMSIEEADAIALEEHESKISFVEGYLRKCQEEDSHFMEMKEKVSNWNPPTEEHTGLKTFMLQQLEVSLHGPGAAKSHEEELESLRSNGPLSGKEWLETEVKSAEEYLVKLHERQAATIETASKATLWLQSLVNSLPE